MRYSPWLLILLAGGAVSPAHAANPLEAEIPNESVMQPLADQIPIVFVGRGAGAAEWDKLPGFWNVVTDPATKKSTLKIKVPLGLNTPPAVPTENPMTVAKWALGKRLYYDKILSSDNTVSCATCHDPAKGFGDSRKSSLGIGGNIGGANAPTVLNSAFNRFQFWDGRAGSLEAQAQGPVGNPIEMFSGKADAWDEAITRIRKDPSYVKAFEQVFGHGPTRDAAAKAIAAYERTVLIGNSIHDRAEQEMRARVTEEETGKFEFKPADYTVAIKAAIAKKDTNALAALGLDADKDAGKAAELGARIANGRTLFFGKARCSNCHVGENFTDHLFHNLGVGVVDGKLPPEDMGRYGSLPTGHKDATQVGAFKTPGLRGLTTTGPYMHNGSEKTLEAVMDLYDKGGNANEFLDAKMRDIDAEEAFLKAKATGSPYTGPQPALITRGGRPIIPFKLNLTPVEKEDLVLFMKALNGDPVDPIVADPAKFPDTAK